MTIRAVNYHFDLIDMGVILHGLLFLFLLEVIIRYNAGIDLEIPYYLFVIEFAAFWVLLRFLPPGLKGTGLWLVWLLAVFCWYNIYDLCNVYNIFRNDYIKIHNSPRENLDEFRRLLDYAANWKVFSRKIWFINFYLFIAWLVFTGADLFIIITSIVFGLVEIFLLSLVYLDKITIDWYLDGIKRPALITRNWYKAIYILLAAVLLFTIILPYNYEPVPVDKIGSWLAAIFTSSQIQPEEIAREQERLPEEDIDQRQQMEEETGIIQLLFFILQVVLGSLFALIILAFILYLLKGEITRTTSLPLFIKRFLLFLLDLIKKIFRSVSKIKIRVNRTRNKIKSGRLSKKTRDKQIKSIKEITLPGNLRRMIFAVYNSMLRLFALRGVERKEYQTPFEFSRSAREKIKEAEKEIDEITRIFVETAYSDHSLSEKTGKIIKSLWKKIKK
ncbi:MAG: DUF4129 domain-containing protein [Halanaerobiales bacterium]